jgi:hypothetical protein
LLQRTTLHDGGIFLEYTGICFVNQEKQTPSENANAIVSDGIFVLILLTQRRRATQSSVLELFAAIPLLDSAIARDPGKQDFA